ncbi:MAG: RagB/SusD family nutrient uptake outer membrane protein, partial [Cyclobacteriaceae bacterium]|nr:RagB/SusD family nutrient uptake outer membrane protein [Cyclobacteriaceae bacterium]
AVLTYIEDVDFEQSVKGQYIGESLALRSLAYFNLVRIFGDVPLVISADADISDSYNTPRSSVADVYSIIVTDLTNAISKLPETYDVSESGRVTQGAAQTLLGQVYLTQKNFADAAAQFSAVIDNDNYSLLGAYEENFVGVNQGNGEAVWQILFKSGAGSMGSAYPNWHAPDGSDGILVPTGGTLGFNQVTNDMYDAYEAGDLRRDVSVGLGYTDNNGVWQDAKYIKLYVDIDPGAGTYDSESDWNLFRYSHVLLMAAEALNEESGPTAKCYEYINAVRSRAGLADLTGLDKSSFRNAVYAEQRVEVAFEGHRWFDLIRTDRAISVMNSKVDAGDTGTSVGPGSPISEFQLLFPLPESVIATSAEGVITQNPGY